MDQLTNQDKTIERQGFIYYDPRLRGFNQNEIIEKLRFINHDSRLRGFRANGELYHNVISNAIALIRQLEEGNLSFQRTIVKLVDAIHETSPKILTTEEYRAWCELLTEERDPLFFECRDGNMAWCWWPAVSPETDMDMYHIWTARPTDAQREATPWQNN